MSDTSEKIEIINNHTVTFLPPVLISHFLSWEHLSTICQSLFTAQLPDSTCFYIFSYFSLPTNHLKESAPTLFLNCWDSWAIYIKPSLIFFCSEIRLFLTFSSHQLVSARVVFRCTQQTPNKNGLCRWALLLCDNVESRGGQVTKLLWYSHRTHVRSQSSLCCLQHVASYLCS